jgi:NitT/TauT family transport system permease protein
MNTRKIIIVFLFIILLFLFGFLTDIFTFKMAFHIGMSLARMFIGYLIAVVIGIVFAMILGLSRLLRYAFKPILSFFISIPTITWVPLLLVITGITEKTIIIAIFLGAFFAVVYNTLDGFDNVDQSIIKAGQILGYSRFGLLYRIYLPASFNNIIVGLKLGIAYSWRALVGAEMLGAAQFGLGFLIFASRKFYDLNLMLISLAFIGILGYLLTRIIVLAIEQNTTVKWGIQ